MVSRAAASSRYVTAASGGGSAASATVVALPSIESTEASAAPGAVQSLTFSDSFFRSYPNLVVDVRFPNFTGDQEILVAHNTGGFLRLRPTVGIGPSTPGDPKLLEEWVDGTIADLASVANAEVNPNLKRLWIAHGRKRSAVRLSDGEWMLAEDRSDFDVTGLTYREKPCALAVDRLNLLLYTVTEEGGVYLESIATASAPVQTAAVSLAGLFSTRERICDVYAWFTPGEEVLLVLTTDRLFTLDAGNLAVLGFTEIVTASGLVDANPVPANSITHLKFSQCERMTVAKNTDGDIIAYVEGIASGYGLSRPSARIIVCCDLDLAGGFADPHFTTPGAPYCTFYNPMPVAPAAWAAFVVTNPDAKKIDYAVARCVAISAGGVDYLYVSHGRMRQVRRLTVTNALSTGITVGAIIVCDAGYTADPATNTSPNFANMAVDTGTPNFEKFILYPEFAFARLIVLNAGLETVATNNELADWTSRAGSKHDIPVIKHTGPVNYAWSGDFRACAYHLRAIDITGAAPTAVHDKYWSSETDGCFYFEDRDSIYMTNFGGVVPFLRATASDPFEPQSAGYQPNSGDDIGTHGVRTTLTEQLSGAPDVNGAGDHRLFACCGEGGFMEYKIDSGTQFLDPARFMPHPAEFELVGLGPPLTGWENAVGTPGVNFYSNCVEYYTVGGQKYVIQDITNRALAQWGLIVYKYNSGTDNWDFFTGVAIPTAYAAFAIPLTQFLNITTDLATRTFAIVAHTDGFFTVRLDELTSHSRVTLCDNQDTRGIATSLKGAVTSLGRIFLHHVSSTSAQIILYPFDTLTGIVDLASPIQVLDSTSLSLPTGSGWGDTFCNLRFLQTDVSGAGILAFGSSGGTYLEFGYDPEAVGTAHATFISVVDPKGRDSFVQWRYRKVGATTSHITSPFAIPGTSEPASVTATATGLEAGAEYEVTASIYHANGPHVGKHVEGEKVTFNTPGASSGPPPKATTLPATNIGATTATLSARVNPHGVQTSVSFRLIGPNGVFTTPAQDAGSGHAFVGITEDVTGLLQDSDYSFQVQAQNALGQTDVGHMLVFSTPHNLSAPKITVLQFAPETIGSTTAVAFVHVDMGDLDGTVFVDYGTSMSYTNSIDVQVGGNQSHVTIPITGLTAGTLYHARASAVNQLGVGVGVDVTFTTLPANAIPGVLTALPSGINQNFVTLHALVDPNGALTTAEFDVWDASQEPPVVTTYESTTTSSSASQVDFVAQVVGLQPFTVYNVRARASNVDGTALGQIVQFRTAGGAGSGPCAVTTDPESLLTSTSAQLNATLGCSGMPTACYFEYWITGQNKSFTPAQFIDFPAFPGGDVITTVAHAITGLTPGATYNYRICAVSAGTDLVQYGATETLVAGAAPTPPPATGVMVSLSPLSATSMRVKGRVTNTNGEDTDIVFQLALTNAFTAIAAQSAPQTIIDPGNPLVIHGADLTGLTANTPYWGRLKMTHQNGLVVSYSLPIGPVSTNAFVPPTVTTNPLTAPTATTLNSSGTVVVPTDIGAGNVTAWLEYGTTPRASGVGYDVVTAPFNLGSAAGSFTPTFQMGSLVPLLPNTIYYARWKANNAAGTVMGAEVSGMTSAASSSSDPAPFASAAKNITPYSFQMEGTLQTNGSATDVVFQMVRANDAAGWASASVISRPTRTIPDTAQTWKIGDNSGFLPAASVGWLWRIKATNSTGIARYAYPSQTTVTCPAPVPHATNPLRFVVNQTSQNLTFIDPYHARLRFYLRHNGKRTWMQMEYGTDPTLVTHTKSRYVSYQGPTPSQLAPGAGTQGEMRYADYLESLTPETTYYARLRCWSTEGEHTGPIYSFTTDTASGTAGFKPWAANWAASVGTQTPAFGMMGKIPANLQTGTGTRSLSTEVDWGPLTYTSAEDSRSIIVTPTSVEVKFDSALNATIRDSASNSASAHPVLAYALRKARVGDKIWVDGTHRSIGGKYTAETGTINEGDIVENVSQTWTGMVHNDRTVGSNPVTRYFQVRILTGTPPPQIAFGADPTYETIQKVGATSNAWTGVSVYYSGTYVYEGFNCGGKVGFQSSPALQYAYWGNALRRYPITGVRILPKTAGTRWGLGNMVFGNGDGGINGVFFRGFDATCLFTQAGPCWITVEHGGGADGIGVRGRKDYTFKQYDPDSYGGWGVKFQTRDQSPCTLDDSDGTYSPANEHTQYIDSPGEINRHGSFMRNIRVTGTSPDGQYTYNQRTFLQIDARGDLSQNSATGPGFPPGRGPFEMKGCEGRAGNQGGCITICGAFCDVVIDTFTHFALPGPNTRQTMVLEDNDPIKGMWFNEMGYQTDEITITGLVTNVGNFQDSCVQTRGVERLTIGDCTWNSPNNKQLFSFWELGLIDNGFVQFTGPGSAAPNALYNWAKWPSATSLSNRIHYKSQGITTQAQFQELQDGKQYSVIQ